MSVSDALRLREALGVGLVVIYFLLAHFKMRSIISSIWLAGRYQ
jgi:hypothetical protein